MNILVIGGGGREHALAWKLSQTPVAEKVFVAPGNAGTAQDAINVPIAASDQPGLIQFAKEQAIDLVVADLDAEVGLDRRHVSTELELEVG